MTTCNQEYQRKKKQIQNRIEKINGDEIFNDDSIVFWSNVARRHESN